MNPWIPHLLRRAGFGLSPVDSDSWVHLDYDAAVERLLAGLHEPVPADPPGFDPFAPGAIEIAWLSRMLISHAPLAEKLALFWHGHFATSIDKVDDAASMWGQYRLFRGSGSRRFRDLVADVSIDPAMLRWLDGPANVRGQSNENYARELMELFTLGVGHYSEHDVRAAARALSGWTLRVGQAMFNSVQHDPGPKTVLGREVEGVKDVVAAVCSQPQCARYMAERLLRFFVLNPAPADAVERLAKVWVSCDGRIDTVLRAMFKDPLFRSEQCLLGQIKSPVEFLVQGLRGQGRTQVPTWAPAALRRMGQALFAPPSVQGWLGGVTWLGALGLVERFQSAAALGSVALAHPDQQLN